MELVDSPLEGAVNKIICFPGADKTHEQRDPLFVLHSCSRRTTNITWMVERRSRKTHCSCSSCLRPCTGRSGGHGLRGGNPVITALCEILSLEQCCDGDVLSFTWYPASIADNAEGVVEMIQRGVVVVVEDDLH